MSSTATLLRRTAFIVSIAAILGVLMAWRRDRLGPGAPDSPPEWPEFTASTTPDPNGSASTPPAPSATITTATAAAPSASTEPAAPSASTEPATESGGGGAATWMRPLDDGSCPPGYPIKAKESSGIFHVPGGRFYDRTHPDRCYANARDAESDGFRQSKT